jgi:fatty acid synthase
VRTTDDRPNPKLSSRDCFQIALTDVLVEMGIKPDGIIGHSMGEMAAGYADAIPRHHQAAVAEEEEDDFLAQGITRAQTMTLAFHRGDTVQQNHALLVGAMAVVQRSWEDTVVECSSAPGVFPACNNGPTSVTVSGGKNEVL